MPPPVDVPSASPSGSIRNISNDKCAGSDVGDTVGGQVAVGDNVGTPCRSGQC